MNSILATHHLHSFSKKHLLEATSILDGDLFNSNNAKSDGQSDNREMKGLQTNNLIEEASNYSVNKEWEQTKVQTSWTATLIALCQFLGSAVTVRVVTVHPSLPESLWSNSIEVNGGLELWNFLISKLTVF